MRRNGAPGAAGGRRRCRGPIPGPARCLPLGASCGQASPSACPCRSAFQRIFLCSRPRASSCREGCRERRLWLCGGQRPPAGRSSPSPPASRRPQAGSQPGGPRGGPTRGGGHRCVFCQRGDLRPRERCPGLMPGLRWSRLIGLARRAADVAAVPGSTGGCRESCGGQLAETQSWRALGRRGKMAG